MSDEFQIMRLFWRRHGRSPSGLWAMVDQDTSDYQQLEALEHARQQLPLNPAWQPGPIVRWTTRLEQV